MIDKAWIDKHLITVKGLNNWATKRSWWVNRGWSDEFDQLTKDQPIQEALWSIYHGQPNKPVCKQCKTESVGFKCFSDGYHEYCSTHCATQSPERNAKIAKGNDYVAVQAKVRTTNLELYGTEHYFASDEGKEKVKTALVASHGVSNPGLSPTVRDKMKATSLERYGIDDLFKSPEHQQTMRLRKLEKYGQYIPNKISESDGEVELREWLNSLGFEFKATYGVLPHGLELDCYDPKCQYAFEYCGLYWHSTRFKHHYYHRNKMNLAAAQGIQLITIFEDEWLNRQEQVKDFIRAKLGLYDRRIAARSTKLVEVSVPDGRAFMNDNHIQGCSRIAHRYMGLTDGETLVGCVSFSRHHRTGKGLVLSRVAFRRGTQVVGGMGKLIAAAKKLGPFITWSDNRWTDGESYRRCGLVNDRNVAADYSYVVGPVRVPKQQMTKKALGCPPEVKEADYCRARGWYQIYDCGKRRWTHEVDDATTDQC